MLLDWEIKVISKVIETILKIPISQVAPRTGVIGSDVPWLECPACNALTWVITVTE